MLSFEIPQIEDKFIHNPTLAIALKNCTFLGEFRYTEAGAGVVWEVLFKVINSGKHLPPPDYR